MCNGHQRCGTFTTGVMVILTTQGVNFVFINRCRKMIPGHWHWRCVRDIQPLATALCVVNKMMIYVTSAPRIQTSKEVDITIHKSGSSTSKRFRQIRTSPPVVMCDIVNPNLVSDCTRMIPYPPPDYPEIIPHQNVTCMSNSVLQTNLSGVDKRPAIVCRIINLDRINQFYSLVKTVNHNKLAVMQRGDHFIASFIGLRKCGPLRIDRVGSRQT